MFGVKGTMIRTLNLISSFYDNQQEFWTLFTGFFEISLILSDSKVLVREGLGVGGRSLAR